MTPCMTKAHLAKRFAALDARPTTLERARQPRVRPIVATISLAAFLCTQYLFPGLLTLSYAQAQERQIARNSVAGERAVRAPLRPAPVGSKPGRVKPSEPTACQGPDCEVDMRALDLSRPPTEKELRKAGQLGGPLSPVGNADVDKLTERLNQELRQAGIPGGLLDSATPNSAPGRLIAEARRKVKRLKDINLSFGQAIQEWNKHDFRKAAKLFKQHLEEFPDSPWAGETTLHLGCDAKYNGRFSEAQATYDALLQSTSGNPNDPSYEIHQKAKLRWADLHLAGGQWEEAAAQLADIIQSGQDWRRKTWARHWLRNADAYKNMRSLRACGSQALSVMLASLGKQQAANKVAALEPPRKAGFSLAELQTIVRRHGVAMQGFKAARAEQVGGMPLPLLVHYDFDLAQRTAAKGDAASSRSHKARVRAYRSPGTTDSDFRASTRAGHFLVVQKIDQAQGLVQLYDPLEKRLYYLTYQQLQREWSGKGLMLAAKDAPGRRAAHTAAKGGRLALLSTVEMIRTTGGCCGVPSPEDDCCENYTGGGSNCGSTGPQGAPVWSVNKVNVNLRVADIPLWYETPVGPDVEISMTYNNHDATTQHTPFGNKWMFNYASYAVEDTAYGGGRVTVFNPDGSKSNYTPNGNGGYISETGDTNALRKLSETRYELEFQGGDKAIYDIPAGTASLQPFLVELRDRFGASLSFGYDSSIHLTTITDAQGKVTRLEYDALGHILKVWDPFGRHASFAYDANGNLIEAVDMEGHAFQYTYDAEVRLTQLNTAQGPWQFRHEGPDGNTSGSDRYAMPGEGMWASQRLTITDPLGQKEEYFYYAGWAMNPQVESNLDGMQTWHVDKRYYRNPTYLFNNSAREVPKTLWVTDTVVGSESKITRTFYPTTDGGMSWESERISYDPNTGMPSAITNARGKTSTITYNAQGQPTSITDPKGQIARFNYAANGQELTSIVNAAGNTVATYSYNAQRLPTAVTTGSGRSSSMTYTAWGAPATVTDAAGQTSFNYDAATKRLVSMSRGNAILGSLTYDVMGRVRTQTDAAGSSVSYEYNNLDQVTRTSYPDGTHVDREYVCCGLVGVVTDRAGRKTFYDYDPLRRLTRMQDAAGRSVQYDYDAAGNLARLSDARNSETRWSYDARNRQVKKTYADGTYESLTYANGLLTARRNAKGQVTSYSYDDNGNPTLINYPNMADVSIAYNALDKPVQMVDGLGTSSFGYDIMGRLTSVDGPFADDTVNYSYDAVGRRQTMTVQDGNDGDEFSYGYDTLGRLNSLGSPAGNFAYSYIGNTGRLSQRQLPNGAVTNLDYDSLHRLISIQNLTGTGANISRYAYGFDAPGTPQRGVRTWMEQQVGVNPIQHINYGYDTVNQLVSEVSTETPIPDVRTLYSYDAMGNRATVQEGTAPDLFGTTYSRNRLNQYTSISATAPNNQSSTDTLSYDESGNLTSYGSMRYGYDDLNRLTRIVRVAAQTGANEHKSEFVYDAQSRKRITREYDWAEGAWELQSETRYVYSGRLVIQERDANNNVTATYTRRGNIGGLLARTTADGHFYYHYDGRGNVSQLTDANQATVARYEYDAFGNTSASGAQAGQPYRFSTKEYHAASGLYDYGFRFYSPGLGRWINRDPIAEAGGLNLYGFVGNSPVNRHDSYGLVTGVEEAAVLWGAAYVCSCVAVYFCMQQPRPPIYSPFPSTPNSPAVSPYPGPANPYPHVVPFPVSPRPAPVYSPFPGTVQGPGAISTVEEVYWHYTNVELSNPEAGLWPGSSTTDRPDYFQDEASQGLGIPPPEYVYPIRPQPGYPVVDAGETPEGGWGPGGLPDFQFPNGSGPNSVGPQRPICRP